MRIPPTLVLLFLLAFVGAPHANAQITVNADRIDALFEPWNRNDTAGGAVAVVANGETVFMRGYGMADLERELAITPETVFPIASVTKQFTGFAIATLVERGELTLDDDVRNSLPAIPDFGVPITLSHLLHHTSGLRDVFELMLIAGYRNDDVHDRTRYWNLIRNQRELDSPPGTEFSYSNTGYFLLAEVVARTTGASFRDWLDTNVFEPLAMHRTHAHDRLDEPIANRAQGYEQANDGTFLRSFATTDSVGDGGIHSTVKDMAAWLTNLQNARIGGERVRDRMLEAGTALKGTPGYGYGLFVDRSHRGLRQVAHGGRSNGFLSHVVHYPDEDFGVVILCNAYPMQPVLDPGALSEAIAEICLGHRMQARPDPSPDATALEFAEVPHTELKRVVGVYWHPHRNYTRRVLLRGTQLYYRLTSGTERRLGALGDDRFVLLDGAPVTVTFESTGDARRMTVGAGSADPDTFERVTTEAAARPTPAQLTTYAGDYFSPELRVVHTVRVLDNRLVLVSTGRPDQELRPIVRNHFNPGAPWWFGYDVHFELDAEQHIRGFRVSNYHAKNIWFERLDP